MSGYTVVFDSVYRGTLCGKWPTLPVWLTILPMADKNGHIDLTYQAITALTGWPIDLLKQAISDLMQPDPDSRSDEEEGRRLVLLDPATRQWGWRVVNHGQYREKARKAAYDSARTESGADADRKQQERASRDVPTPPAMSRDVPRCPDTSRSHTPNADSNADSEKNLPSVGTRARKKNPAIQMPPDFALDDRMRGQALERAADCDVDAAFAQFRAHHEARDSRFVSWPAAWVTWIGNFARFGYPKLVKSNGVSAEQVRREIAQGKRDAAGNPIMFGGKQVEWQ